jgi:hypothetical protein
LSFFLPDGTKPNVLRHLHRCVTPSSPRIVLVVILGGWLVLRLTGSLTLLLGAVAVRLLNRGLTIFSGRLVADVFEDIQCEIVKGAAPWAQNLHALAATYSIASAA